MSEHILKRFEGYLRYERGMSELTRTAYLGDIALWLKLEGKADMDDNAQLTDFLLSFDNRKARKSLIKLMSNGNTPRSVKRRLSAIRGLYNYLMKIELIERNPFKAVQVPKDGQYLPTFVNADVLTKRIEQLYKEAAEVDTLEQQRLGWQHAFIVDLLFQTGMREAELVGLTLNNIDTREGRLKVLGKRNKERIIPLGSLICEKINLYLGYRSPSVDGCEQFLLDDKGKAATSQYIYKVVTKALAPLPQYSRKSPHVLRHSFATAMLNNGADLMSVKELLGHESISSTAVYTHTTFEELRKMYNAHPRSRGCTRKERRTDHEDEGTSSEF
ncbi:tyrosine-type recombinase/integrase [Porphyromonas levii]|uniref:tyrosine-type recombinase/integrase n=1 Tax=Porphyromonas levii TaxID=28114 RepID=UPI00037C723B|nr:tyrosine-type recombinase/integrase [Porphyromonas levii]